MKFPLVFILYLVCLDIQAQKFVSFNMGYILADSIVSMDIKSETVTIFFWSDTIIPNEIISNIYDTVGNLINQTNICDLPRRSTVQNRAFDHKNRMIQDSRYYYPDIPISKNIYIFNDDTIPLKMEIAGYLFTEGILDNFSRHISLYNEKGHLLDDKSYDQNGTMVSHEKYLIEENGLRSATITFTNNGKDSIITYREEDYGLPFNDPVSDYNSLAKYDTLEQIKQDGSKVLYIYETKNLPIKIDPDLVEVITYYKNGLLKEIRKINSYIRRFDYQYY